MWNSRWESMRSLFQSITMSSRSAGYCHIAARKPAVIQPIQRLGADFVLLVDEMLANTKPVDSGQLIAAYRASIPREVEAASAAGQ